MFKKDGSSSSCHSFKHSWLKYLFKQLVLWHLRAGIHELLVTGSVTSFLMLRHCPSEVQDDWQGQRLQLMICGSMCWYVEEEWGSDLGVMAMLTFYFLRSV